MVPLPPGLRSLPTPESWAGPTLQQPCLYPVLVPHTCPWPRISPWTGVPAQEPQVQKGRDIGEGRALPGVAWWKAREQSRAWGHQGCSPSPRATSVPLTSGCGVSVPCPLRLPTPWLPPVPTCLASVHCPPLSFQSQLSHQTAACLRPPGLPLGPHSWSGTRGQLLRHRSPYTA